MWSRNLPHLNASLQGWTHNALGQLIESNGVQQYPVKYAYDDRGGRLRKLTTGVGSAAEGTTSWGYNGYGWLTTKRDANNQGADYSYTSGGQLYQRQWARVLPGTATRLTATYAYHSRTAGLDSVSYNDAGVTPGYTTAYDRLGRLDLVTQGGNSWDYTYDDADGGDGISLLLDTETVKYDTDGNGTFDFTRVLDRGHDTLLRNTGWALQNGGSTEHSNTFEYDPFDGRLTEVSDGTDSFGYLYLAGSDLVKHLTGPHTISVENFWEEDSPRAVLKQKINRFGGTVKSKYVYNVNELTRRTGVTQTVDGTTNTIAWGYNGRGEVQSADRSGGAGNDRFYAYDTAGNRQKRRHGAASDSGGTLTSFTANTRNQYAGSGAISGGISASPTYDADGNQLTSFLPANPANAAQWIWNAENQLIEAKSAGSTVGNYKYDPLGRRIAKTASGVTTWFVYDGWNMIAEYQSTSLTRAHTWGSDLSGTMQGAGGVGGLFSTRIVGTGTFYPLYDGNGNICQYLNSAGAIAFGVEYDASGIVASVSHTPSHAFHFRFSSKYEDFETGLNYYGYRYLDTQAGRWLSRDPIGERGGLNLYGMVGNDPVNAIDPLGLKKRISVDSKKCLITITLNITIFHQKGDDGTVDLDSVAARIKQSIEGSWNGFKKECCDVSVTANVTADKTNRTRWGASGDNEVGITSDPNHRSYVQGSSGGLWSAGADDWTYGHEAGHLMGLPDDYSDQSDGASKPNPGHEGHMMGDHGGTVDQHEIDDILKKTKCKCDKK